MRTLRIDVDGITELDLDEDGIRTPDRSWDCVALDDGHDIWVDDSGLFRSPGRVAAFGDRRIPIPGFVLGAKGENSVAATIGIERVRELVKPNQSLIASIPAPFAALTVSTCSDPSGTAVWRVIIALPGESDNVVEFLMRTPGERIFDGEGNRLACSVPFSAEEQILALQYLLQRHGVSMIAVTTWTANTEVVQTLGDVGIEIRVENNAPHHPVLGTTYGIGGAEELELQAVLDPTLPEFDWDEFIGNPRD